MGIASVYASEIGSMLAGLVVHQRKWQRARKNASALAKAVCTTTKIGVMLVKLVVYVRKICLLKAQHLFSF